MISVKNPTSLRATDLKIGDKVVADKDAHGLRLEPGKTYIVKSFVNQHMPMDRDEKCIMVTSEDGGFAGAHYVCRFNKKVEERVFPVDSRVRYKAGSRLADNYPGEYTVGGHGRTGRWRDYVYLLEIGGLHDYRSLELVPAKPEPRTTMTKRILTDVTVRCASGDGSSLLIGYDPTGNKDNDGPCVDFEAVDVTSQFNGIDIEDIETLDAVIKTLQAMREDFVKDSAS